MKFKIVICKLECLALKTKSIPDTHRSGDAGSAFRTRTYVSDALCIVGGRTTGCSNSNSNLEENSREVKKVKWWTKCENKKAVEWEHRRRG